MACWQDETIPLLRILIDDFDPATYTFSDQRLDQTLIAAAQYINMDIEFDVTYTITTSTLTISPDPADVTVDQVFMNFMVLKAACIIDVSSARTAAMTAGLEAKCGPAVMRTLRRMDGFGTLLDKGSCALYDEAKLQHQFGNVKWIKGILSPFVNSTLFPSLFTTSGPYYDPRVNLR